MLVAYSRHNTVPFAVGVPSGRGVGVTCRHYRCDRFITLSILNWSARRNLACHTEVTKGSISLLSIRLYARMGHGEADSSALISTNALVA